MPKPGIGCMTPQRCGLLRAMPHGGSPGGEARRGGLLYGTGANLDMKRDAGSRLGAEMHQADGRSWLPRPRSRAAISLRRPRAIINYS
jgi:hypothetical protein